MNTFQPAFDTVTEALSWLAKQGYTYDFNLDENCIKYNNNKYSMSPDEFDIEYVFRFEGVTDPGDEILYMQSLLRYMLLRVCLPALLECMPIRFLPR